MAHDIDQQILDHQRQFDFVAQKIWPKVAACLKAVSLPVAVNVSFPRAFPISL